MPTNILLHKMKIKNNDKCEYCGTRDFIEHFFFHCNKLSGFWTLVAHNVHRLASVSIAIDEKTALFGILYENEILRLEKKTVDTINAILLIARMSVSKFRYGKFHYPKDIFIKELGYREKQL